MAHHFTTTHSHDYRWPHSTCMIPKAEAPNSHCEWKGEGVDKPWCERNAPQPSPRSELELPRACADTAPIADRPWCQRGPLVPRISPPTSTPALLKVRPDECPANYLSHEKQRSGSNDRQCQNPSRQKLGPKGCHEEYQAPLRKNLQSNSCFEPNQTNQNRRMEPVGCFTEFSGVSRNSPKMGPEGCYEEPVTSNRHWRDQDLVVSVRMGAAPQQETSQYDQPNQYLQKLCDKYPKPTAVVAATPRDELMRRVYADRYRTTYQTDYCKNGDDTARLLNNCDNHEPGQTIKGQGKLVPVGQLASCGCSVAGHTYSSTIQSAGDSPTPSLQAPTCRPAPVSHNVHFSCCYTTRQKQAMQGKVISGSESIGPPEKLPPWISEYSDSIGRTGQVIIDQKLLYPKSKKNKF